MPTTAPAVPSQAILITEFVILFIALPIGFRYRPLPFPPIPALWLLAAYGLYRLLHDPNFDRGKLWNPAALPASAAHIVIAFALVALLVASGVHFLAPQRLFNFVRRAPAVWAIVMCLYPVLSVYQQGIVYRAFFFERYRSLFPNSVALIVASAVAFSFAHIIFRNPIAVSFTLVGGLLFAWRYAATGSLFTSAFEHALYGCGVFTVGLGRWFYHGAVRVA